MIASTSSLALRGRALRRVVLMAAGLLAMAIGYAGAAPPATGGEKLVSSGLDKNGELHLRPGRSVELTTVRPYKRVNVGEPEVADVNATTPSRILVTGKKAGVTQLIIWDDQERSQIIDVTVAGEQLSLPEQLRQIFPDSKIEVVNVNGSIVLRGRVASLQTAEQVGQIAGTYAGGNAKVLNFLEVAGGQQVMLQVRFAEVSKSALSALGINAAVAEERFLAGNNIGQINPLSAFTPGNVLGGDRLNPSFGDQSVNSSVTLFGAGKIGSVYLQAFVQALRQNNLLRILAEPNLVAISGQEASFLAGGEFPIPVVQSAAAGGGSNSISVEFREFGVKLAFVPVVLGDGKIRLKVAPEVSDLDFTTAVRFSGFVVPGLSQRKVMTTVELSDGQSFAIAGLLNNTMTSSRDSVPLLGDLPIVGALFKSVRYQRKETELVVLVTPRLVSPLNPGQVPPLPGERWRHPNESDLFYMRDLGGPAQATEGAAPAAPRNAPLFYGPYGFTPATQPSPK